MALTCARSARPGPIDNFGNRNENVDAFLVFNFFMMYFFLISSFVNLRSIPLAKKRPIAHLGDGVRLVTGVWPSTLTMIQYAPVKHAVGCTNQHRSIGVSSGLVTSPI